MKKTDKNDVIEVRESDAKKRHDKNQVNFFKSASPNYYLNRYKQ